MEKDEIFRYIQVGASKSISVERRLLNLYPGVIRDIIIRADAELQIDFLDKYAIEMEEGEVTFYFYYEDYDKLFEAVENFTGVKMNNWNNYTKIGWYPEVNEINLDKSWENIMNDFVNKTIYFPKGYKKYRIASLYWQALDSGDIKVNDSMDVFDKWMRKKMKEDMEKYTDE